jgi:hypothetical protein
MRHDRYAPLLALAVLALCASAGCESDHTYYDVAADTLDVPDAAEGTEGDGDETPSEAGDAEDEAPVDSGPPLSCAEVLTCLQGCGTDGACVTACQTRVCAANTTLLDALMTCIDANCATECADRSSTDCSNCGTSSCATEGFACYTATCG